MGSKQRLTLIFTMLTLATLMLFFQNCSSGEGLYSDSSVTDGFITDPPQIFASKTGGCNVPAITFTTSESVFICIKMAGPAPKYCHTYAGDTNCSYYTLSSGVGWSSMVPGEWVKEFPPYKTNPTAGFGVGSFMTYVVHTDDPTAYGQAGFSVSQ
jgi:hypothetical protein